MQEKYGLIYLWFDKKHKKFYLGRHWGAIDDNYICSSVNMRNNYKNRPYDFKRRIVKIVDTKEQLVLEEQRYLDMIKHNECGKRYYNKSLRASTPTTRGYKHTPETIEKIRLANIGKIVKEETKQKLREYNIQQFGNENAREHNRQKALEQWANPEYRRARSEEKKGIKQSLETIQKRRLSRRANKLRTNNG